jgi:hypothetical protein
MPPQLEREDTRFLPVDYLKSCGTKIEVHLRSVGNLTAVLAPINCDVEGRVRVVTCVRI